MECASLKVSTGFAVPMAGEWMMKRLVTVLALAAAAIPAGAMAQVTANLEWGDPGTLVPAGNAPQPVVVVSVYGQNVSPVDGGHPDYREYWHIFMRNVGPDGVAGPWSHCDGSDGCGLYEWTGEEMDLKVDLRRWARVNHSRLQVRLYTGLDDPAATDPSVNLYHQPLSDWSNIWTWKIEAVPAEAGRPPPPHCGPCQIAAADPRGPAAQRDSAVSPRFGGAAGDRGAGPGDAETKGNARAGGWGGATAEVGGGVHDGLPFVGVVRCIKVA